MSFSVKASAYFRLCRPLQWSKNLFVFIPLFFAGKLLNFPDLKRTVIAAAVFCIASSAVYVFNDLVDYRRDRRHPRKRLRPISAGEIKRNAAAVFAGILAVCAIGGGFGVDGRFVLILVAYLGVNVLYSLVMKKIVFLDLLTLSGCFMLRLEGGGIAANCPLSEWLFICAFFLTLFLGIQKRLSEWTRMERDKRVSRPVLRHYNGEILSHFSSSIEACTILSYSLYTFASPLGKNMVYTIPFVVFGIFRYHYAVYCMKAGEVPEKILCRDWPFLVNFLLWGGSCFLICYVH